MGKSYYTITPRDLEIIAFAREVPYFNVELVHKYFYGGESGSEYAKKKLLFLEQQGVLKGWKWVGVKKLYSIAPAGNRYLNIAAEGLENRYFNPHMHLLFRPVKYIKTEYIPHTLRLIDMLLKLNQFKFFDQVFLFDNVMEKDRFTKYRPDIYMNKGKHKIYFEYEATTKRPAHIFEKFSNYINDKPALVLYVCKDEYLVERVMRYMGEFRSSSSAYNLRFLSHQLKYSELFYFAAGTPRPGLETGAGEGLKFRNCINKKLKIDDIIKKLS